MYYGSAMSEGESVRGEDVYIVGGANSAGQAAMYFSRFAKNVTMLVRGKSLSKTMSRYLIDQIDATENIRLWTETEVKEILGSDRLAELVLSSNSDQTIKTVPAASLFIFIGALPHTDWLGDTVARDPHGFILSGTDIATSIGTPAGEQPGPRRVSATKGLRNWMALTAPSADLP